LLIEGVLVGLVLAFSKAEIVFSGPLDVAARHYCVLTLAQVLLICHQIRTRCLQFESLDHFLQRALLQRAQALLPGGLTLLVGFGRKVVIAGPGCFHALSLTET